MKHAFLGALTSLLFVSTAAVARNPTGETAHYVLDKGNGRTSEVISSGDAHDDVAGATADGSGYAVNLSYDFSVIFIGDETDTIELDMPAAYFTPEFMPNLRQTRHFETAMFKADHLGFRDATTVSGQSYPHCDYLHLYDIKLPSRLAASLSRLLMAEAASSGVDPQSLDFANQDLQMWAQISDQIPALGAAKLDVSGKASGQSFKAGLDYAP